MKFPRAIPCLLASFTIVAADLAIRSGPNCTVFKWNQEPAYLLNRQPHRISAAKTCHSESHACPIVVVDQAYPLSWDYNVSRTLPDTFWATKDGEGASFYYLLINGSLPTPSESSTGVPFTSYVQGTIDTIQAVPAGASGYLQMVPIYQCYDGTLSNCTGNVNEPVGIQACAPTYYTSGTSDGWPLIINADFSIHNVSADSVPNYPNPFAGESSSGADSVRVYSRWLALLSAVMVAKIIIL